MSNSLLKTVDKLGLYSPVSDIDASNLSLELFSSGYNFRTVDDKILSYSGKAELYAPTADFKGGLIDYIFSSGNTYYVVLGRIAAQVYNGVSWTDISPALGFSLSAGQELDWTATKLGNIPIYNNSNLHPLYWSPQQTSQSLQYLKFDAGNTWKDKGYTCAVMRAHKNFLFALNLVEGANTYPYSYRWSHPADNNSLPPSWDDSDLAYIASKEQIAGSGGDIVDGQSLRDAFCIYSKNAITILNYIGGEFIWNAQSLSGYYGLIASNCVVEHKGVHFFISDGDILRNDGNSLVSILKQRLRRKFASSISNSNYTSCFALAVPNKDEVWFFIVEEGSTYPSIVYIYNATADTVSLREVSNITHATYAPKAAADDSWDSGFNATDPWGLSVESWDYTKYSLFDSHVLGVSDLSTIYTLDETYNAYNTVLERTDWIPDNNIDSASTILNVFPKIKSSGTVLIQLGSQQHVGGVVSWKPAIVFNPNTDRKVAMRTTGKCHAWRVSSIDNNKFEISGFGIQYTYAGAR